MEQAPEQNNLFGLNIDDPIRNHLFETARWGRFLAIIGFIVCGLLVVLGIYFVTSVNTSPGGYRGRYDMYDQGSAFEGLGTMMAVVYVLMALLYFFPCLFLLRFSGKMKAALAANDQAQLTSSFQNLKVLFRYIGILTIIVLAIYALALIGMALGS